MTAASLFKSASRDGLQAVDLSRHLGGIAELIEVCFSGELDAGARSLIREMRWLSHAGPILRVLQALMLGQQPWNMGYVWMAGGRVVGTASTQRAAPRSTTWLVANVAVHPDFRRRGIASALMRATLDLIRSEGGDEAILQVDDDNLGALALYRGMGFERVTTQTTWVRPAHLAPPPYAPTPFDIRLQAPGEWADQYALAAETRPEGLTWGHPLTPGTFRPGWLQRLNRWLSGRPEEQWVVFPRRATRAPTPLAGSLTLQWNTPEGDRLVMMVQPQFRGQLERPLLVRGLRRLGRRARQVRVEHDADDPTAAAALHDLGFRPRRTLRWMQRQLR